MSGVKSDLTIEKPSPQDLPKFLPWACTQLSLSEIVIVRRLTLNELSIGDRGKNKGKVTHKELIPSITDFHTTINGRDKSKSIIDFLVADDRDLVKLVAVYRNDDIVKLKFEQNKSIPRQLLRLIGLTIQFHKHLQALSFNSGVDRYTIYEVAKFLPYSHITDICLDGLFVKEANYHILLNEPTTLKYLSLSRCKLDDNVIQIIASKLVHPKAASKTLSILNLSSNMITDVGATYLAKALRSNRQLSYLNLASNMIYDDGAIEILRSLKEFLLTPEEAFEAKERLMNFSRDKQNCINKLMENIKEVGETEKKLKKAQFVKKNKGLEKESSLKTVHGKETESFYHLKATKLAEEITGEYHDPFSNVNVILKDGKLYCLGNHHLAYLSLAYNNMGYRSIKELLSVLNHQKLIAKQPRGLVNVCIEGNPLPKDCSELVEIDSVLDMGLLLLTKGQYAQKKRLLLKK